MSLKLIVYDLDGTLVDTLGDVSHSLNVAMAQHGLPTFAPEAILPFFGHGIKELVQNAIGTQNQHLTDSVIHIFRQHYFQNLNNQSKLYPGLESMLKKLYSKQIPQAVLTNKQEKPSKKLLKLLGIDHYFSLIAGPDTYNSHKPDPEGLLHVLEHHDIEPQDAIMIGDSDTDIWAAHHAKVRSIAVLYGYRNQDIIVQAKPTHTVESVLELEELLIALL